jgi:aminobenzoyl-glutamate utilization protein B
MRNKYLFIALFFVTFAGLAQKPKKQGPLSPIDKLKAEAIAAVEARKDQAQQINDMLFSFSELGFQETETFTYLTTLLEKEGFTIQKNISGMPTAWIATWGSGKPVIAIGSDIDCIPKASQKPGVAYRDPIVEGAPGHGEGHNSGQALNIVAALAVKKLMERDKISGTLMLWPGVAEELVGAKAFYIRDGYFKDVDACIFTHVGDNFNTSYGDAGNNGLISVRFTFEGSAAHAAGAPWRGRSALDAVELMNIGWNYRREHLELTQRSHYAQRGPFKGSGLVLLPGTELPEDSQAVRDRYSHGRGCGKNDRHEVYLRNPGISLAGAFQQAHCRSHVGQHQKSRPAYLVGRGSVIGKSHAERDGSPQSGRSGR